MVSRGEIVYCALLVEGEGKEWGGVATRVGRQDDRGGAADMMRHASEFASRESKAAGDVRWGATVQAPL